MKKFSSKKYINELLSYYAAKNSILKSSFLNNNLSAEDKVIKYREENPVICCPSSIIYWNTWGIQYNLASTNWENT